MPVVRMRPMRLADSEGHVFRIFMIFVLAGVPFTVFTVGITNLSEWRMPTFPARQRRWFTWVWVPSFRPQF